MIKSPAQVLSVTSESLRGLFGYRNRDYACDDPLNLAFARNELPNDLLPVGEKQ